MLDDLAAWGAPQDIIDAKRASKEIDKDFPVWAENWDVTIAFLNSTTQWRVAEVMSGLRIIGFDYAGVKAGLKLAGIKLKSDQWSDLQVMERAALQALNSRE